MRWGSLLSGLRANSGWVAAWAVLVAVALSVRPLLAVDETRYLSVAWEMWSGGDWLVPHLNGVPYSDKPPLLFWTVNLVWALAGVNETLARLVSPVFGLGSLVLTVLLGRLLWPGTAIASAAWVVLGTLVWTGASTLSMFDVLLSFWVLTALAGVVLASRDATHGVRGSRRRMVAGWFLFGLGIGAGVLSKGPVVLVFTLPAALLAPLWIRGSAAGFWRRWYLGTGAGVALAAAVALAWALPAASSGGTAYGDAILWGQTGSRIVNAAAHGRPFWWYVPMALVFFFPWIWWPPLWRSLPRLAWAADSGARFCAVWLIAGLVLLSLVSGKQPHYLLPAVPALALLLARAVAAGAPERRRVDAVPAILLALAGLAATGVAAAAAMFPDWTAGARMPPGAIGALLALGLAGLGLGAVLVVWRRGPGASVPALALASIGAVIAAHLAAAGPVAPLYDLQPAAQRIAALSRSGHPVAHVGKYHGQYQFLGRIEGPIAVIGADQVGEWFDRNPGGVVIAYHRTPPGPGAAPIYSQPFRSRVLAIWDAEGARADLGKFRR